jgi:AbrB family looped-hinge helix DNA binding protein
MNKATLTSKGQITIPKEIREHMQLSTGDCVNFIINDDSSVTFEKDKQTELCPVCFGQGEHSYDNATNIEPCFMCDQSKYVYKHLSAWQQIADIKALKYGLSITIAQQEISNENGSFEDIPEVRLKTKGYMFGNKYIIHDRILHIAQDYLQMKFIEEYSPRSGSNADKLETPSDVELESILALLKTDKAKKDVTRWFRYERTFIEFLD